MTKQNVMWNMCLSAQIEHRRNWKKKKKKKKKKTTDTKREKGVYNGVGITEYGANTGISGNKETEY